MGNIRGSKGKERCTGKLIKRLFPVLSSRYEFDSGWPGGDWPVTGRFHPPRFEIIIGSLLTQNTRWENVEMALASMAAKELTSAGDILRAETGCVEDAIRSSGFFRQKAAALINICRLWESNLGIPPDDCPRKELLEISRIGPETADSIILYALGRPEFIADTYTRRLVFRLGIFDDLPDYQTVKAVFEQNLPREIPVYRQLHALIVLHAKKHCRKKPFCNDCPFRIAGDCRWPLVD
jgi:endonuclease-3 related protein